MAGVQIPVQIVPLQVSSPTTNGKNNPSIGGKLEELITWTAPIVVIFFIDQFLAACCRDLGWSFPSSILGLLLMVLTLIVLTAYRKPWADAMCGFFQPALTWIHRWLPLFYLPPLVNLPDELSKLPAKDMLGAVFIVTFGWVANLWFTQKMTLWIRAITNRDVKDKHLSQTSTSFSIIHTKVWVTISILGLVLLAVTGSAHNNLPRIVFSLATTVCGLLLGNKLYSGPVRFLHPIMTCAVVAYLGAGVGGLVDGAGWYQGVRMYLPKGAEEVGAGSILMLFLDSVVISFGFDVFAQRSTMMHHQWEIILGIAACSSFSILSTIALGRLLRMQSDVILALTPRSVTVALALPMANALGSKLATITAGAVVLTGLLGANFSQSLLNYFGATDPVVRGVSSASCGHGLATAALGSTEPKTLAFCSLAYVLSGVFGTLLVQVPVVCQILKSLAGDSLQVMLFGKQ